MLFRRMWTELTLMRTMYVQRCLRTMLSGTNHADCVSIPANSIQFVPESPGYRLELETFPLHICSSTGCSHTLCSDAA